MFLHQHSENCKFGRTCKNMLCQFKHIGDSDNAVEEEIKDDLLDKFNNLTDMEKQESKEVFCDLYCNRGYDCHRCSQETNEEFIGCDIRNVTDVFETDDEEVDPVTYYPCKDCDESFDDNGKLRKHFSRTHKPEENVKWLDVSFSVKKSMC